jgi:hypothetical protein
LLFFAFDFRSLAVVSQNGYRLFAITSINKVDEIFSSENEDTKIAERLFSSSLVAVVTNTEPTKLKVFHNNLPEFQQNSKQRKTIQEIPNLSLIMITKNIVCQTS